MENNSNILIKQNFIKTIPRDRLQKVLEITNSLFKKLQENNYDHTKVANGYYIRQVKGRKKKGKVFKFRINNGDRVLFTFRNECGEHIREIDGKFVLLEFVNHNEQIVKGRKITLENISIDENYGKEDWHEDNLDEEVDYKFQNYDINLSQYISRIVKFNEMIKLTDEDDNAIYYLNEEQYSCLDNKLDPLFLIGGAGTGKSTIGLYKLHSLCTTYNNIVYLTYSDKLTNEMKEHFIKLCVNLDTPRNYIKNVKFYSINNFFLQYGYENTIKQSEVITFPKFKTWYYDGLFKNNKYSKFNIDLNDVWKEIRGVIKGVTGKNWSGGEFELKKYLNEATVDFLLNERLIEEKKKNIYIFKTNYLQILRSLNKAFNKLLIQNDIFKLESIIMEKISASSMITKDEYLELSSDFTIFNYDERNMIYDIAMKYQAYLISNNYIDDNDIARKALEKVSKGDINRFDYVLIDEIQDLTEVQIYTLYNLSIDIKNFYMNGDFNQTINPTLFRLNRIESLFKSFNKDVNFTNKKITINYRNSANIVNFTNSIINLKNNIFSENDALIKGLRKSGENPVLLKGNYTNKNELIKATLKRAYVAVIVAEEDDKRELINYFKSDYSEDELRGIIFTVNEIKGLERKYIVCYNIISKFSGKWDYMINNLAYIKDKSNSSRFRYYFNMYYVAITRARDNICFYEEKDVSFYETTDYPIDTVEEFDLFDLHLEKESTEKEFYNIGVEDEYNQLYDSAIKNYILSQSKLGSFGAERCRGKQLRESGKVSEAIDHFINAREFNLAAECYEEIEIYNEAANYYYKAENYEKSLELYRRIGDRENEMKVLLSKLKSESRKVTKNLNSSMDNIKKYFNL